MKKMIFAVFMILTAFVAQVSAQNELPSGVDSAAIATFNYVGSKLVNSLPNTHVVRYEDSKEILKSAEADGFGIEPFVGGSYNKVFVPVGGLNFRYDGKKFSFRVGAYFESREQNSESMEAGKKYLSYGATTAMHYNLLYRGAHTNALSLYGEVGYLFGKHKKLVGEEVSEDFEGTILKTVSHKGSGLTYGGGVEWRHNFFATGNALNVRVGYEAIPNTYWNDTNLNSVIKVQIGFTFGISRHRFVNASYKSVKNNR